MKTGNIFLILFLVLALIPISSGYDPIEDNNMQALVWCSLDEGQVWVNDVERVETQLLIAGFNVTKMFDPSPSAIYNFIGDNDVKIYYGLGHGNDYSANTGNGYVRGYLFQNTVVNRNPITISTFQHCGDFECYDDGRWLQAGTSGDNNVVARRYYGDGWCAQDTMTDLVYSVTESTEYEHNTELCILDTTNITNTTYGLKGFEVYSVLHFLNQGYTYSDADDMTDHWREPGKKQGNRDLRYPQYCGDVDYDMDVDREDATLLSNYLDNLDMYSVHSEWDADVNGDMSIDEQDLILLEQHIHNPDRYPLHPRGWFINETWELYDTDASGYIDSCEVTEAINDYFSELITLELVNAVVTAHDIPVCEKYDTEPPFNSLSTEEVIYAINDSITGCLDKPGVVAVINCYYS